LADLPRCVLAAWEGGDDLQFQAGMVFDLKPSVPVRPETCFVQASADYSAAFP